MQVVIRWFFLLSAVLVALPVSLLAQESLRDMRPRPLAWALDAVRSGNWDKAARIASRDGRVAMDLVEWYRLRAGRGSYGEVLGFLTARSDWPGLDRLRARSEDAVIAQSDAEVLDFFDTRPAQTAKGTLAHATALSRAGRSDEAKALVIQAWRNLRLSTIDQALFLAQHSKLLAQHHTDRLDEMLWRGWHAEARRMFALVDKDQQALANARIALQRRAGNVDEMIAAVPKALLSDPGLAQARFEWRVRKGRWNDAKDLLLERSVTRDSLGQPATWANRRRELARDELRDGDASRAFRIASTHHLTGGPAYADLEWLSGYIALTRLNNPEQALTHFDNHDSAVVSPISQGRAGYWKGRAHRAAGNEAAAVAEFTKGAAYQTSFYGLLAAEEIGLPFDVGLGDVPTQDWRSSPIARDSLFQAGLLLAASGERNLAEWFWTHLASQLGPDDVAVLGQAAIDIGEPHLAVMIGKTAARTGEIVPLPYYPLHPLARTALPVSPELALAIARRESEFDPVVVSGAGARGLMQIMPKTARQVASGLGLAEEHETARLTEDPVYNARLGTVYLAELVQRFDGNVVMVAAGYNAGPSRPIQWMERFGDPRGGSIEGLIDWIEGIPFRETRNYVMRVAESLPIYRARLGQEPLPIPFSRELLGRSLRN